MREILFRGKSVGDLAPWIYGYYHFDKTIPAHYICDKNSLYRYEVIPETVGQFTGLKDKHGKDIFEGDIIDDENSNYAPVIWSQDECQFLVNYDFDPQELGTWCIVKSNIHDNPELLQP